MSFRRQLSLWCLALAPALFSLATPASAFDTFIVGPRAMGMGGANVASVSDTTGQYYNPAIFGFFGCRTENGEKIACDNNNVGRKSWGLDLNAAGGYRLHNEFGAFLDNLVNLPIDQLSTAATLGESDLVDLVKLIKDLEGLDTPGNAITADLTAGLGIRAGHFAFGSRVYFQGSGVVLDIDTMNLGLDGLSTDLSTQIDAIDPAGNDFETLLLTTDQQATLIAAGLDATDIQKIDFLFRQEGITKDQLDGAVDLLAQVTQQTNGTLPGGSLSDNTTTVRLSGFGLLEFPLSYGYAIGDHWSIGGNIKLMVGRVYGSEVIAFDNGSSDVIESIDENFKESTNFGLDLGIMGRYRYFNFGLVARNLNSPEFDGPTVTFPFNGGSKTVKFDDVTLHPQVTAGIAFIPFETLTLEADMDLTSNSTTFPGYKTQNLSFGLEWDAFRSLALRGGLYRNLSEKDIKWIYTAGLGLNLWAVRLDVAAAVAAKTQEFDGEDIPQEIRVAAQLAVDF